jgi:hypothetical protein
MDVIHLEPMPTRTVSVVSVSSIPVVSRSSLLPWHGNPSMTNGKCYGEHGNHQQSMEIWHDLTNFKGGNPPQWCLGDVWVYSNFNHQQPQAWANLNLPSLAESPDGDWTLSINLWMTCSTSHTVLEDVQRVTVLLPASIPISWISRLYLFWRHTLASRLPGNISCFGLSFCIYLHIYIYTHVIYIYICHR